MYEPFTIITPTGDRPDAFELCCKYVQRQTIKPVEWIVIDDGETPTTMPDNCNYLKFIKRKNREKPIQFAYPNERCLETRHNRYHNHN